MRCPRCGQENPSEASFCDNCGQRLGPTTEPSTGAPATATGATYTTPTAPLTPTYGGPPAGTPPPSKRQSNTPLLVGGIGAAVVALLACACVGILVFNAVNSGATATANALAAANQTATAAARVTPTPAATASPTPAPASPTAAGPSPSPAGSTPQAARLNLQAYTAPSGAYSLQAPAGWKVEETNETNLTGTTWEPADSSGIVLAGFSDAFSVPLTNESWNLLATPFIQAELGAIGATDIRFQPIQASGSQASQEFAFTRLGQEFRGRIQFQQPKQTRVYFVQVILRSDLWTFLQPQVNQIVQSFKPAT